MNYLVCIEHDKDCKTYSRKGWFEVLELLRRNAQANRVIIQKSGDSPKRILYTKEQQKR